LVWAVNKAGEIVPQRNKHNRDTDLSGGHDTVRELVSRMALEAFEQRHAATGKAVRSLLLRQARGAVKVGDWGGETDARQFQRLLWTHDDR
jgi:hypothetical protein